MGLSSKSTNLITILPIKVGLIGKKKCLPSTAWW
jgi:hypothetical protein